MARKKSNKARIDNTAARLTRWVGSPASVVAHTIAFALAFLFGLAGIAEWDTVLLVLTTIVSLEAIYLSIFIQMSVNRNTESLKEVESDIDEMQEDVEEMKEDVEEMEGHMGEIREDVEDISEDVDEIREDVEEISEDEKEDEVRDKDTKATLDSIQAAMAKLMEDIDRLKKGK